jgi:hypothetical protein
MCTGCSCWARGNIHIWGCFTRYGVDELLLIRENVNEPLYTRMLCYILLTTMRKQGFEAENCSTCKTEQ